jgi:hypothetical protein
VEAFQEMVRWKNGEVFETENNENLTPNIPSEENWQSLLLAAVQKMDEAEHLEATPAFSYSPPAISPPEEEPSPAPDLQSWCDVTLAEHSGKILASRGCTSPNPWSELIHTLCTSTSGSFAQLNWGGTFRLDLVGAEDCAVAGFRPTIAWFAFSHIPNTDPRDLERTATLLICRDPFRALLESKSSPSKF